MTPAEAKLLLLLTAGEAAFARGELAKAGAAFRSALQLRSDCPRAHLGLSRIVWPGPDYLALLARIHRLLRPHSYVEIGVGGGASLALARDCERVIAIDPAPSATVAAGLPITEASQTYLSRNDLARDLGGLPFDFCFIDGSHLFEDAAEDFLAIERFAGPRSLVAIHDCLPLDAATATRERQTSFWTGDVWKLVPLLRDARPALTITTISCPPSGLCLVSGFGGAASPPERPFAEYAALRFEDFAALLPKFAMRPAEALETVLCQEHCLA